MDMMRTGTPVKGLDAAWNRDLNGTRAALRQSRVELTTALGFMA